MKRHHDSDEEILTDEEEQEPPTSKPRLEEGESLEEIHKGSTRNENDGSEIQKRLYETHIQYYTMHMGKIMKQVPMGGQIVDIVKQIDSGN
ncbi:hypothetical protein AVEN_68534-1 [Araneus ventricosus]|uniref:Uncharacterized protein n=1 Tax=Araneus ventricosus TaxID=182803 RepID=A0A4Y2HCQ7_ARAVE|nr:hypothetical protein AVEN_68534-1 [Araneus ventricosus]